MLDFECDGHEFVGRIFDLAPSVHLGIYEYEKLPKIAPDRAYVFAVERALSHLVERVGSLLFVQKLLAVVDFPVETIAGPISRTEWLWGALELMAVRFVSISDTALILANEVLELGLTSRKATQQRVLPLVTDAVTRSALESLLDACKKIRGERDKVVHWGERRRLGTSEKSAILFKSVAFMEVIGSNLKGYRRDETEFDTRGEHAVIADEINKELDNAGKELMTALACLFDALWPHFEKRWKDKLGRSQLGLS